MKNEEKAAIIMLALAEDVATEVMKNFTPSEIKRLGKLMSRISHVPAETMNSVAQDFIKLAEEQSGTITVNKKYTTRIVQKALEGSKVAILEGHQPGEIYEENPIVDKLRDVDTKYLMEYTKTEHPQTIALILAHLNPEQAAEIMESYPLALQYEIARRIATLKAVPEEFIEEVARTLEKEILVGITVEKEVGGPKVVAEILNRLSRSSEQEIMSKMEESDAPMALQIRNFMFSFDDVLKLDDKSLQELLREVSSSDLTKALKLVDEGLREKIYRNISKRAADMLKEEISLLPPLRVSEVEQSQRTIVDLARRLEAEGRIYISRGGEAEDGFV